MNQDAELKTLSLERLAEGCPALTASAGQSLTEAASVCFEEQGHPAYANLHVSGDHEALYRIKRFDVTEQMRLCYNDREEATELGACAVAILIV